MLLSDISVKRPVFALVMSLMLVAFGVLSFSQLPVREFPDMDVPIVSVNTSYSGASAQVIESRITRIIEDNISGIEGIKSISSTSSDGRSSVNIEFEMGRDIEGAANDVRDKISRVVANLPQEADAPEVFKVNSEERPIIWYNLSSDVMDIMQITDYAQRNVVDRFSVIEGVARVSISGTRYAMRVWLNRIQLAARGLTVEDVENALRSENIELPGGRLEGPDRDFTIRIERSYLSPIDFEKLVISQGIDGHLIRLVEVARVELAARDYRSDFRGNGQSSIGIGIVKQSTSNTLAVANAANAEIKKIKEFLPDSFAINAIYDSSGFVRAAIKEVYKTLFISMGLVILVIYLFLGNVKSALVPSVTVPVCLISTFFLLNTAGFSINLLTLLALVLTIGLVVDDAIVVLENITRRVEEGEPALLAAYRGARQVSFAIVATTLVLVGVFIPVIFMEGSVGRLFSELALTLVGAVLISSFVALTLSPMMCSKLLSRRANKTALTKKLDQLFIFTIKVYESALKVCFKNKFPIILILVASVFVAKGFTGVIPQEFMPTEDRSVLVVNARLPEGTGFVATKKELLKIEAKLMEGVEKGYISRLLLRIPAGWGGTGGAVNSGSGYVVLPEYDKRKMTTKEVTAWTMKQLADFTDSSIFVSEFGGMRGGGGNPVEFVVGAESYAQLAYFKGVLLKSVKNNPGIINVDVDYRETQPQIRVDVDKDRAADIGVSARTIGRTLETLLRGRRVTTYIERDEEYDVMLQGELEDRAQIEDIDNIYVRSEQTRELVPLSNLVTIREGADAGTLKRYNRVRSLTLTAGLAPGYTLGEALEYLEDLVATELPNVVSVDYKGESREFKEAGSALVFMFLFALLVVFLILSAQFESFIHPFIIMLTVPLAISGGLAGLYIMDNSLNIYSQVGMIILIALASKNGILIVEFANQLRDKGLSVDDALMEAAKIRLRPILMTGISTAAGAIPLVIATGPGSISRASMGIVIAAGVIFATFFTLFIIPVFYKILAPYTKSPGAIAETLKGHEERFK